MPEPQDWLEEDEELSGGRSRKAQAGLQIGAGLALLALLIPPLLMVLALLEQERQPQTPQPPINPGALS
ncbi:putative conserved membrane protein [Synechococcus sp. Minos11]|jgi:hypothetical protein|uniref:hypothetical protein n=1 Tax=Synechococcus sp. Minos11 TaxID=221341 RepID=UPI000152610C|nr:hypothetical protein [Synechococcus sp. Minos11]MEC8608011.1 hypothetical protein [Cyanobacteriota bacterium]NBQ36424.1 hypothetical protein [Synechococcus sp.]OUW39215.1 MAG: hypothetical protein CBD45_07520 [Synechococcus sp. TMED185]RCL63046.1 MAG: hypothetical protein DBW81_03145 [Synechococcus sp. MED-G67]CAK28415.1 Uncharacterized membrane protein [Synechococcus sp. RCC307]HCA62342.1 hypothetical protein [Synechococcales bacterium UBA8647]HCV56270.1 hypothetical protein [Synechococc|tara:strand:- start:718 stop:924 length:207 start_codon:yes stop_codon:yes gene_type:complete